LIAEVLATSVILLVIGYSVAISARDLIRLIIALELMFSAVLLSILPLFSVKSLSLEASGLAVITIFTSSSELLVLISAIILLDKRFRSISIEKISAGGDEI